MSFARSEDKHAFKCVVERPDQASYLFFQKFHLQIGDSYELVDGMAFNVRHGKFPNGVLGHSNNFAHPEYLFLVQQNNGPDESMFTLDKESKTRK